MAQLVRGDPFALVVAEKDFAFRAARPSKGVPQSEGNFRELRPLAVQRQTHDTTHSRLLAVFSVRSETDDKTAVIPSYQAINSVVAIPGAVRQCGHSVKA